MSDICTNTSQAQTLGSPTRSASVELLDDANTNDIRRKILALRQQKKAELSASATLSVNQALSTDSNRLTWVGVEDDSQSPAASRPMSSRQSRYTDDEDDADSTVLGHYILALPIPPQKPPSVENKPHRLSVASADTCSSSHRSSSQMSCLLDDDLDAHSLHTTTATDSSSGPSSRRSSSARASIKSQRQWNHAPSKDATVAAPSKPRGPPPSMPLPPKPSSSPHPLSPSTKAAEFWPSRRSSRASALTTLSSRSSTSVRSSGKSTNPSIASPCSIPSPSVGNDACDLSEEELTSIRNISNQFPSPISPYIPRRPSASRTQEANRMRARSRSESRAGPSRTGSQSRGCEATPRKALIQVQDCPTNLPFSKVSTSDDRIDAAQGEESNDSTLSDVLDLADNRGVLMVGRRRQQASVLSSVGVARVGLGARTLSQRVSEHSLRSPSQSSKAASSLRSEQQEVMQGTLDKQVQPSTSSPHEAGKHHQRSGTLSQSMSELMAALDLEASEWGQRLGLTEKRDSRTMHADQPQTRESHLLDSKPPEAQLSHLRSHDSAQQVVPASDSMPSLSSTGSQELSLDDSRGPATAETSLVRSNSAKSMASLQGSADTAHDNGASVEFRSIYDAYRGSTSTLASRFTAPVVRIEDPEGDEVSDSELEGDVSSSDDMPRKRNKSGRKKPFGFEQQRVSLRPRPSVLSRSASLSAKAGSTFQSTLPPTEEEDIASSSSAPTNITTEGSDPYAFYEFSPSLPPFMPNGLSPRDLTGRGTWSSIVARASERMRSRQPSLTSLDSFTTTASASGPVSLRHIRATARAKQRQADAAHRARELMSNQFAALSYRPFAIHQHAASFASQGGASPDPFSSASSNFGVGSTVEGMTSGRSSAMSSPGGYADSMAAGVGDYGTRWPVAIGADDDVTSTFSMTHYSLSRSPSGSQAPAKKYVEFSMQTSPQSSPTEVEFASVNTLTVDEEAPRADAQVETNVSVSSTLDYLGIDAPLRRRRSTASLLSTHDLNAELDQPGLWPSHIRAPRLSSIARRRSSDGQQTGSAAVEPEAGSEDESDLDVDASLEDLAERSGVLDESRGFKRKMHSTAIEAHEMGSVDDRAERPIASIPARSRRISAALDRIRAQRISRGAGWVDSDDEDLDGPAAGMLKTPRRTTKSGRPSLPGSVSSEDKNGAGPLRRSKSLVSVRNSSSPSMLRVRSPSPDLSILTNPSEDEEVLLTADLDLDPTELSHRTVLDEEFDMMVGSTIASRFSSSAKPSGQAQTQQGRGEPTDSSIKKAPTNDSGKAVEGGEQNGSDDSKDSQQTVQMQTRSRTSSMSSVIEIIQEADELLSSTGHSIGHSSGHDTSISDSGGTSGHDPQRPNHAAAEIIRHRMSMRSRGLPTPVRLATARTVQPSGLAVCEHESATEAVKIDANDDEAFSPSVQDTPDTMAGSEIWTSFHADRSSNASTATTWSYRSTEDAQSAPRTSLTSIAAMPDLKEDESICASAAADDGDDGPAAAKAGAVETSVTRAIPVLRRKSSGLPVARSISQKASRPSLPLAAKSSALQLNRGSQGSSAGSNAASPPAIPTMRRNQSVSSLRSHITSDGGSKTAEPTSVTPAKQTPRAAARYSDGQCALTPSKGIRSVGGGITPSKLPGLKSMASTPSLASSRALASGGPGARTSPMPQRSQLLSPKVVRASGLPRPAPAPASTGS
ncbi:hypothetical protein EX895_002064 [Sporisorium graminicola]|uniref:Uncharacterized protein n=1 Tax=Sporisorium graminicola TaxID=280036 RepID=A0A4U7KW33_9BASI|nr:hypothetical protein EX895_002064 [Sporisorium graminicola]TKY88823.1 hypothetical protein EX895_002064 [Sporisorium graminicola]